MKWTIGSSAQMASCDAQEGDLVYIEAVHVSGAGSLVSATTGLSPHVVVVPEFADDLRATRPRGWSGKRTDKNPLKIRVDVPFIVPYKAQIIAEGGRSAAAVYDLWITIERSKRPLKERLPAFLAKAFILTAHPTITLYGLSPQAGFPLPDGVWAMMSTDTATVSIDDGTNSLSTKLLAGVFTPMGFGPRLRGPNDVPPTISTSAPIANLICYTVL